VLEDSAKITLTEHRMWFWNSVAI